MKYIIDTDPGIDDAIAIMMALRHHLDIIGFTLATGNIPLEKAENNLKIIEDFMESNIPIFKGAHLNTCNPETAEHAHGKDGLGYAVFPKNITRQTEKMTAEDFIIKASKKYPNNLTIICLGPFTNLANAIKKDPTLVHRVSKVVTMSATYNPNSNEFYKEFNIRIDPISAQIVYGSAFKEIQAITHEIGVQAFIEKDYIQNLKHSDDNISRLISLIAEKYIEFSYEHYNTIGLGTPDPITIASILDENLITFEPFNIEISTNAETYAECYATPNEKSNIYLSTSFDLEKYRNIFKNTFK